jgi:hypothetical protein
MARASFVKRVVYTIDEFPFRDRELAEPTWAPMIDRQIRWPRARALPPAQMTGQQVAQSQMPFTVS